MKRIAVILPIISAILFGSVGVFVRTLDGAGFNNITIIFSRAVLAAIMMFVCVLIKDRSLFKIKARDFIYLMGCAVLGMLGTNLCFNISSTHLSLSLAAVLLSIFPIYVLIFSRLLFGEKLTGRKIICMIMALAGCVMVSGIIGSSVEVSTIGMIVGLISGITYGGYGIISKLAMEKGINSLTITFYCLFILAVILIPFADYGTVIDYIEQDPFKNFGFMILHSLCIGVLPYLCYTIALQYVEPGKASILASCEPVAAMVFGLIFFSEKPDAMAICGLAVTIVALMVMCKKE